MQYFNIPPDVSKAFRYFFLQLNIPGDSEICGLAPQGAACINKDALLNAALKIGVILKFKNLNVVTLVMTL